MTNLKRVLCCFVLIATAAVATPAHAWHGWRHGHGHGFYGHGYGFGTNHHSFRPSIYNPGWSSYARANFYGGVGYWPRTSYGYGLYGAGIYSGGFYGGGFYSGGYWPTYSYGAYFAPSYYAPLPVYRTYYTPIVAPVIYRSFYSTFPTCVVGPVTPSPTLVNNPPLANYAAYTTKKPVAGSVPFRLASQPLQASGARLISAQASSAQASSGGRYVLAETDVAGQVAGQVVGQVAGQVVGQDGLSAAALDLAPEELISAADAILSAGGYRQAAQAYGQLVVQYGNSDRLATRRFVAQVANGDFEQAAVVVELAIANGNQFRRADLPQGDLQIALGDSRGLIAQRIEGLSATALQKSEDAVAMLAVANWLALSGDDERANLFKSHAEQLQKADTGLLVQAPSVSPLRYEGSVGVQ